MFHRTNYIKNREAVKPSVLSFITKDKIESNTFEWIIDLISLAILFGVFYAIWLGSYPLFTPDEGRYSEVAREMVTSGDYVTPRLNGVAFLDKPALYYWLQASAIHLIGLKEWALRFWPAFMGILGSLIVYFTGRQFFNRRTGIISAIILITSPLYYGAAHYANLDLEVAVLISNALLLFMAGIQTEAKRLSSAFFITAYIFCALAALTKGLIGIVFPAMIIGSWVILLNRWNILKKMHLFTGILIFLAITAPWYILVQKANPEFLHFFFVTQQVSRFLTTNDFNNKTAMWFYFPIVMAGFFPWTIFLIQAISQKVKAVWQNRREHSVELFLLLWLGIIFTFFSIPKSKTVGYILPIYPALALLVGHYLATLWDQPKAKGIHFALALFALTSVVIFAVCLGTPFIQTLGVTPGLIPYLTIVGVVFLTAAILLFFVSRQTNLLGVFSSLALTAGIFLLTFIASATYINQKTVKPLALEIKSVIEPNDEVVTFFKYYQDLPLYLERRITIVADWQASDIPHNDNWVRELWYGMVFQDTKDWLIDKNTFWQRWHSDKRLYVLTDAGYYDDLKRDSKIPVYKVDQYHNIILLTNKPFRPV